MIDVIILLLDILTIFNIFFALTVVLNERKNPGITWAWLFVVLVIPYIGFILYLAFGSEVRKNSKFKNKKKIYEHFRLDKYNSRVSVENRLITLNNNCANAEYTEKNNIDIYKNGNDKFKQLLEDIEQAKTSINLQYYIVKDDELSNTIIRALTEKCKQGLEVRFLIDGMGCARTSKRIFKEMKNAGGHLGIFLPPYFLRINFRNHRKIVVIDNNIGYIGGLNIGNEYLGNDEKFGHWRDIHLRILGDSVANLQNRFISDWNFCSKQKIISSQFINLSKIQVDNKVGIQIVSSGPDTNFSAIQYAYLKMINDAKNYIYIQTPYFVPDESVFECLKVAALSGVDVRIMIPAKPDHIFVYSAAMSYLEELIKCGVKCYLYKKGFVHSKMIVIDNKIASVGTANMDVRSFKLNFEVNAVIYDELNARKLADIFMDDIEDSEKLTLEKFEKRGNLNKIKESIARLISPIL